MGKTLKGLEERTLKKIQEIKKDLFKKEMKGKLKRKQIKK